MMKKGWDKIVYGLIFVLVLCFFTPTAYAMGNISLGRLEVHPGIEAKIDFWDNIFYQSDMYGKVDDVLYTLSPFVVMGYDGEPGNYLKAGAFVDFVMYTDYSDNNYQTYNPFIYFGWKSPMGLYLRADDEYYWTKDPYGGRNSYSIGKNTKRWNNGLTLTLGYDFDIFSGEVTYKNYIEKWDLFKDQWQNRMDNVGAFSFFYHLSGKTSLLGQFRYTKAAYTEQNDGINQPIGPLGGAIPTGTRRWNSANSQDYYLMDFFVGARFEPGGKLTGEIKLGYGSKKFDNKMDPDGNEYSDHNDFIAETDVTYQALPKTSINFNLQRAPLGSPDGDAATYIDTRALLMVNQDFAYKLSGSLGFELMDQNYQDVVQGKPDKEFIVYSFIVGLDYDIQDWLKAGVEYKYENKQASNTDYLPYLAQEYKSNKFSLMITGTF